MGEPVAAIAQKYEAQASQDDMANPKVTKVVMIRHGESTWNQENRFTGWTDVDLSEKGHKEAKKGADILKNEGYTFDVAYTSVLKRAIRTLWYVMDGLDLMWIPVHNTWRLNERHYGALQGLNKAETAAKYGDQQVCLLEHCFGHWGLSRGFCFLGAPCCQTCLVSSPPQLVTALVAGGLCMPFCVLISLGDGNI